MRVDHLVLGFGLAATMSCGGVTADSGSEPGGGAGAPVSVAANGGTKAGAGYGQGIANGGASGTASGSGSRTVGGDDSHPLRNLPPTTVPCSRLDGNDLPLTRATQDPPLARGGTIANGEYWLTEAQYLGESGDDHRWLVGPSKLTFADGSAELQTIEIVGSGELPDGPIGSTRESIVFQDTSFTSTLTCGGSGTRSGSYTATDHEVILVTSTEFLTYTRR